MILPAVSVPSLRIQPWVKTLPSGSRTWIQVSEDRLNVSMNSPVRDASRNRARRLRTGLHSVFMMFSSLGLMETVNLSSGRTLKAVPDEMKASVSPMRSLQTSQSLTAPVHERLTAEVSSPWIARNPLNPYPC